MFGFQTKGPAIGIRVSPAHHFKNQQTAPVNFPDLISLFRQPRQPIQDQISHRDQEIAIREFRADDLPVIGLVFRTTNGRLSDAGVRT